MKDRPERAHDRDSIDPRQSPYLTSLFESDASEVAPLRPESEEAFHPPERCQIRAISLIVASRQDAALALLKAKVAERSVATMANDGSALSPLGDFTCGNPIDHKAKTATCSMISTFRDSHALKAMSICCAADSVIQCSAAGCSRN